MSEKKYVNGLLIKEKEFDNGGKQMKVSVKVSDFIANLKEVAGNDEWVNLIINRRKEPSDTGITHYTYVDTWKPEAGKKQSTATKPLAGSDLPF
tara:strand:+ start:292 stop:573 length:282 start_codon:yes stop_codon:yes gene_type:complete